MPKIFKRFSQPEADDYIFRPAEELTPGGQTRAAAGDASGEIPEEELPASPEEQQLRFAQIQAEAILADARNEAEQYKEEARREFEEELERLREAARQDGYNQGYAEGMAAAAEEGRKERQELAQQQVEAVELFLEQAARERDRMLDNSKEELKDLAVAIAEKVIRVSLKNSSDILLRMVDAATDTHKRCEWAHIYVADCDVEGKAYTATELASALGHISSRIRVIPMADDESGTCIVELPDVILDASVSTQLENIREVLDSVSLDRDDQTNRSY